MEKSTAVAALAALAQDNRLDVYRLLVQADPDGPHLFGLLGPCPRWAICRAFAFSIASCALSN